MTNVIFIMGLVSLLACQSIGAGGNEPPVATLPSDPFAADWHDRAIFRSGLVKAEQDILDELPGASTYRIKLQISDDLLAFTGQEEVLYTNRETVTLNEIYFRLFANTMGGQGAVADVKVNGQVVSPEYEFQNSAIRVPLPAPLAPGEQAHLQLNFVVQAGQTSAGNYGLFGYIDEFLMLDGFYPVIPVYTEKGWYLQVPPPNADTSYSDVSFYLVQVTAPARLTVAASGVEVERRVEADRQILTFAAGPARDFYLAASENFAVVSATIGETTVNSYAPSDQMGQAELALEFTANALRTFNQQFIPYPYTEFDVLGLPIEALGIEYPGIVGISLLLYDPDQKIGAVSSRILLESTVVHEVGHQWFYNLVGNDQIDEPWLDESLVQYTTIIYFTNVYGQATGWTVRASWENQWQAIGRPDMPIGLPAAAYTRDEYTAVVYGRGPLFITALAETMGQRSFNEFFRDYQQTHKWRHSSTASFKQLAEQHCQCDLTGLFETWVYEK
ncbi:MAG: M1 family metallopeptidase [Anaerolineae bacterium]|nr:M1 family metallopeptidase [Anaerolineae bacterium]